jgi:hypothetical protein
MSSPLDRFRQKLERAVPDPRFSYQGLTEPDRAAGDHVDELLRSSVYTVVGALDVAALAPHRESFVSDPFGIAKLLRLHNGQAGVKLTDFSRNALAAFIQDVARDQGFPALLQRAVQAVAADQAMGVAEAQFLTTPLAEDVFVQDQALLNPLLGVDLGKDPDGHTAVHLYTRNAAIWERVLHGVQDALTPAQ